MKKLIYKLEDFWYNTKYGIKNIKRYLPVIWRLRPWGYENSLEFQRVFLTELLEKKIQDYENESDKQKKIIDMKRCIQLMDNILEDKYLQRSGWIPADNVWFDECEETKNLPDEQKLYEMKTDSKMSAEERSDIVKNSRKLENVEWNELWDTIKKGKKSKGARAWWN